MLQIQFACECDSVVLDEAQARTAIGSILDEAGVRRGSVSVAVVDDSVIHELNRRYLEHDYPTDVLSFLLERKGDLLEGEVIVSAATARRTAQRLGWPAEHELLLYVVHGALHLAGYDDLDPESKARMRQQERRVLAGVGIEAKYESVE
jgi:probable rRNA maturation factor